MENLLGNMYGSALKISSEGTEQFCDQMTSTVNPTLAFNGYIPRLEHPALFALAPAMYNDPRQMIKRHPKT